MDYGHGKRMNDERDRLSELPDDLIHKILGCIFISQAIATSALSSRWRYLWTSMPFLNFSSNDFYTLSEFCKFVTFFLFKRNNQIEVSSLTLQFPGKASQEFVKDILNYAFSHGVQKLNISCLHRKKMEYAASLCSSLSLKHLTFTGYYSRHSVLTPITWKLPALTTLDLYFVTLYDDNTADKCGGLFSNLANLKNLTLGNCRMTGLNGFSICHPGISSLTLKRGSQDVNVVAPQLKNLTIEYWTGVFLISTPNLSSLRYENEYDPLELSANFLHLEKVDICISRSSKDKKVAHKLVCLLQQLHSVKFLTLNLESIKVLSSYVELISYQPSPFANLKGLKIYPHYVPLKEETQQEETMATEVKNYLLGSSLGATFTMLSHEEIRAVKNVASTRDLMRELQEVLDALKENSETETTDKDQGKAPSESHMATLGEQVEVENCRAQPDTKMKWRLGERMTHIKSYWEHLNVTVMPEGYKYTRWYKNTSRTFEIVQEIEEKLTKLPALHRDMLQARFSFLYAEAETVMDSMMDCMKIEFDKKPDRSNVSFHELATTSEPSS